MANFDKRIDDYVANARDFAKPVLEYIRSAVHEACPDVRETIKWGMPHFEYRDKILCGMASFKEHCAMNFRLGSLMKDPHGLMQTRGEKTGMGHFGRITTVKDLPARKVLVRYVQEAMALTESGARVARTPGKVLAVPQDFMRALNKNKTARRNFDDFSPSHRNEYVEWITEAKTTDTRNRRIVTALTWLEQGKGRNWKHTK